MKKSKHQLSTIIYDLLNLGNLINSKKPTTQKARYLCKCILGMNKIVKITVNIGLHDAEKNLLT